MPLPISHAIVFICINVVTDLLIWIIPFTYYPSNYVPQIDSPVPDQLNTGLITYVPHSLIALPVPPQPTSLALAGYFDLQPTSPASLGYFDPMPEPVLRAIFESPCGPTAYFDRIYTAIKRTDLLCPERSPFPECLFSGNGGFIKSLIEFDWEASVYHSIAIRFIAGLLCEYIYRCIFAYLLNSPTSIQQVALWDKMRRFFRFILPRRSRDLVFQNPSPLQTVDVSTQTEPFVPGIDAYAQADPFVQTADTSTQTGVPDLSSSKLPPMTHPPILWAQKAVSILRPRNSISAGIRDRSRVFQLPQELGFLDNE